MKKVVSTVAAALLTASLLTGIASAAPNIKSSDEAVKAANDYYTDVIKTSADGDDGIPLVKYAIDSVDASNDKDVVLSVALTYEEIGTLPSMPVHVVKTDGHYEVKRELFTYDQDPSSPDYGKIKKGNIIEQKVASGSGTVTPSVVINGSYYNNRIPGTTAGSGATIKSYLVGQSWSNTSTNVTINGWQNVYSAPMGEQISLRYGVAAKIAGGGYTDLKSGSYIDGNVPSSGTWFNVYLSGVATGDGRCVFIENRSTSSADVAGNAYQ